MGEKEGLFKSLTPEHPQSAEQPRTRADLNLISELRFLSPSLRFISAFLLEIFFLSQGSGAGTRSKSVYLTTLSVEEAGFGRITCFSSSFLSSTPGLEEEREITALGDRFLYR